MAPIPVLNSCLESEDGGKGLKRLTLECVCGGYACTITGQVGRFESLNIRNDPIHSLFFIWPTICSFKAIRIFEEFARLSRAGWLYHARACIFHYPVCRF